MRSDSSRNGKLERAELQQMLMTVLTIEDEGNKPAMIEKKLDEIMADTDVRIARVQRDVRQCGVVWGGRCAWSGIAGLGDSRGGVSRVASRCSTTRRTWAPSSRS